MVRGILESKKHKRSDVRVCRQPARETCDISRSDENQKPGFVVPDPAKSRCLKQRGQRDEKGCEEVAKDCCNSSRPTTSQTQLDWPSETVEMDETEMCVEFCLWPRRTFKQSPGPREQRGSHDPQARGGPLGQHHQQFWSHLLLGQSLGLPWWLVRWRRALWQAFPWALQT